MRVDIIYQGSVAYSLRRKELSVTFTDNGFKVYDISDPCKRVLIGAFNSEYSFIVMEGQAVVTVHH